MFFHVFVGFEGYLPEAHSYFGESLLFERHARHLFKKHMLPRFYG